MALPIVFICYSHKDEVEKDKLVSHLSVLQGDLISAWSDDIPPADVDWEERLNKTISEAKVAIMIISADFLTSLFTSDKEVRLFLERSNKGLHVLPVIAKACAWHRVEWLKAMNVRPRRGRPIWGDAATHVDEDLASIADEVADVIGQKTDLVSSIAVNPSLPLPIAPPISERKVKTVSSNKLLMVDDDPRFRRSIVFGLRDMNIDLLEAETIEGGVELLRLHSDVRIILLDLDFKDEIGGTALLDFIKDRSSYYRVIILTGHEEKLAAEKASSYNIFAYLAKVGNQPPMQTLRFAVTRAIDDLKRGNVDESTDLMARYPTPFVYIYQHLKSDMTPLEKLVSQKDMLELVLHFSGIVLLSEYLNSEPRNDELDAQIRNRIYKPALGDWFNLVNEILKHRAHDGQNAFLISFLTFFTGRNKKILGDFIVVRNKYVGHGTKHSDYEYENVVKKCDGWLETLLQGYQFICRFLLCYVLNVQIIRGNYIYSLKECVGANPQLLNSTRPLNVVLNTREMHLIDLVNQTSKPLSLYPFIILENCADCRHLEIFFYSKCSNGQLHYISYKTGHWTIRNDLTKDFLALLGASA